MKFHSIILAALTALLLFSCRNSEEDIPVDTRQKPICIGGGQLADMTPVNRSAAPGNRAAAYPLEQDHQSFKLWGYKTTAYGLTTSIYTSHQNVMDQYIVQWRANSAGTSSSNVADWEYVGIPNDYAAGVGGLQTIKYWDFAATSYRYFGLATNDESGILYGEQLTDGNWFYNISFNADATNPSTAPLISKMWFSSNPSEYGKTVNLEFLKPVTKVRIRIIDANGQTITPISQGFTDLSFAPANGDAHIVQKGKLKVSYALTGPTTVANYLPQVEIVGDPTGTVQIPQSLDEHYNDFFYVLPHVKQGDFKLSGTIGSAKKEATVPQEYMSWFPNVEYTYIFKMTNHDFQFIDIVQIGVTEWQMENSTHDIYNW